MPPGPRGPITIDPYLQEAKLIASDGAALDEFGSSVAMSGNTLVVGAEYATISGRSAEGAVYVFTKSGSTLTQPLKLTPTSGVAGEDFG